MINKKMKILVTGGAGFIGSNLVRHLNMAGYTDISIVDDMTDGSKFANMKDLIFSGGYADKDDFLTAMSRFKNKFDYIFHLGAISSTTHQNGKDLIKSSYDYLINLALNFDCPIQYSSSASVYGNRKDGSLDPLNCYAFSKKLCDDFARNFLNNTGRKNIFGLRYFNVYGPGENHKLKHNQCSPILSFYNQAKTYPHIINVFDIVAKRDFIHVDDVCKFHIWAMENNTQSIAPIDVGTGNSVEFQTIAALVREHCGFAPTVAFTPMPPHLKGAYQYHTKAQPHMEGVGYTERLMQIEEGVLSYVTWLKNNQG